MPFNIIYLTFPDQKVAEKLTDHLLAKRLIACANLFPIKSAYWWQGTLEKEDEVVAIVKTQAKHWKSVEREVAANHPYETPCIMKIEAEANEAYENWITQMTEAAHV